MQQIPNTRSKALSYGFFVQHSSKNQVVFSLKLSESDLNPNEVILNSLISTLVKYGPSGKIEPYLASRFETSKDGLEWIFFIRPNLRDESDKIISGNRFAENFKKQLLNYSKSSSVMDFEHLVGWQTFKVEGGKFPGIHSTESTVKFLFSKKPEDLLEFLRMPYFGFWPNQDDSKNEISQFLSSGAYSVDRLNSTAKKIVLKKRPKWIDDNLESPIEINFSYVNQDDLDQNTWDIIQFSGINKPILKTKSHKIIDAPPAILYSMVISPYKKGPFQELSNRQAFVTRFKDLQERSALIKSQYFYPSAVSVLNKRSLTSFSNSMKGARLRFAFPSRNYNFEMQKEIIRLSTEIIETAGGKVSFESKDPLEENWRQRLLSNMEFDARMNGVDIGGHPQNLVLKMIFCSKLGVSYPDHSGRICELVNSQDENGGSISKDYITKMNQILYEDSSVIPLSHSGTSWILNDRIDPESFPSTVVAPLFERVLFK